MLASDIRIFSSRLAAAWSSSSSFSFSARVSSITADGVLSGLFQRAHLLAQLVAPRLQLFRGRNRLAPALVQRLKIPQQRRRVRPPRAQFFFNKFQVGPDKSQIEHRSNSLNDPTAAKVPIPYFPIPYS